MTWRSVAPMVSPHASPRTRWFVTLGLSVTALLGGLAIQSVAHAVPIGDFSWNEHTEDECATGLCGAFFSVGNFSSDPDFSLGLLGDSFFDVFVDLETDAGPQSLSLGAEIAPFESSQSIEDLFGQTIVSAGLRLTFGVPALPGSVRLLDPDGNVVTGLTAQGALLIDYAVDEIVVPVPEPSTLLMLTSGLIGLAVGRRAHQQHATTGRSRTKHSRRLIAT